MRTEPPGRTGSQGRVRGALEAEIVGCRACSRLVEWRERTAAKKVARFADQEYWGRPVPGFGDSAARVLVVGLAPAAHGGNRTGRIFTGDRSGDFLFGSLHRTGFANRAHSVSRDDGLRVRGLYLTSVNRCCPPGNRPTPPERDRCLPFLARDVASLEYLRVVVALGTYAWGGFLRAAALLGHDATPRPKFAHAARAALGPYALLGCYHPSQQNTFTGRLTEGMIDEVMVLARYLAGYADRGPG